MKYKIGECYLEVIFNLLLSSEPELRFDWNGEGFMVGFFSFEGYRTKVRFWCVFSMFVLYDYLFVNPLLSVTL